MANTLTKKKYEESQKVLDAFANYNNYKDNNKPSDYVFSDAEQLKNTEDKYYNRKDFSYDLYQDPLYNQYKHTYITEGKRAMEDAVGNAAGLTGGYTNSYAQSVGMQAYNEKLDKLNDIVPELYEAAYSRYESELDRLETKLGYLTDKNKEEYSRYLDSYNIYSKEVDALRDLYLQEYENDMAIQDSEWESAYKIAMAQQEREIANANLGYKYYAANLQQAQFDAEMQYKQEQAAKDNELKDYELRLKRMQIANENAQYWNDYNEKTRESIREDEIYALMKKGDMYEAICALDQKYQDNEVARYKALLMGFDKDYVDAYFNAQP